MNPDSLMLGAGAIAYAGSFKEAGGFPANGWAIIGGTVALSFLFALAKSGPLSGPAKGLAGLMLLTAIYRYTPGLFNRKKV